MFWNYIYNVNRLLWSVGLRFPIYKAMSRDQVPPPASHPVTEANTSEIDVSDLGSRSYAARTDFYCLVTDDIWTWNTHTFFLFHSNE